VINKLKIIPAAAAVLSALFLFSCATAAETGVGAVISGSPTPVYYGTGSGSTSIDAIQQAKKAAVKKAAEDLLGTAAAKAQKSEIEELFTSISDIEPFTVAGSMETLESSQDDGFYINLGVMVNLSVTASELRAADILGGQVDGREGNTYLLPDQAAPRVAKKPDKTETVQPAAAEEKSGGQESVEAPAEQPVYSDVTADELAIINDYLDSLMYMVYFDEDSSADPVLMRTAVVSANRYLKQNGFEYVDLSQIESIKADQRIVYEEETGESVSMIQWIAHKLNADIYIQISLDTSSRAENGNYYGSASALLNCYNASTAEGRGSAVYQTIPPAFSRISEADALSNAVSSAVYNGMQTAVAEAEKQTAEAAARGFKYSLNLMNTPDSKLIRDFEKRLERKVKSVKRISYSPEESVFEVYLIGDIMKLEDVIYDTAENVPGMEGLLLIMQRGSSITFDTGL